MSTKFHDAAHGAYHSNGKDYVRHALLRAQIVKRDIWAETIKDHHFKVFRLGLDICARCQKPRSEHPRATR